MKKIAVAGFGFMGLTHTLNILRSKNLKLVAIVDKDPELIDKTLDKKGGNISTGSIDSAAISAINKYSSLEECLNNEDLDAVNICVPTSLHYDLTKKALLAGKHVFLEKPLCLDIDQAEDLINLAEKNDKIFMTGHVVRFMPPYQKLKNWVDTKEFGNLRFLNLSRFSGRPGWGQWKEKEIADNSGGALFDLLIHDIDYASYILGLPDKIDCTCLPGNISKHDYLSAVWSYNDRNIHVSIEGGNPFHSNFPFQAGYMAGFDNASVFYTTLKGEIIQIADDDKIVEIEAGNAVEGYFNEINYFSQCLEKHSQPADCMPSSSLQSVKLCHEHLKNQKI